MEILIIDHSAKTRDMIIEYLDEEEWIFHHCTDDLEAVSIYEKTQPDWVIMDINNNQFSCAITGFQILKKDPKAKIVILSDFDEFEFKRAIEKYGIKHYQFKNDPAQLRKIFS